MVYIYSKRTLLKAIGVIISLYLFAVIVTYFKGVYNDAPIDMDFVNAIVLGAIIVFFTFIIFYYAYLRGRKIEISEEGINIGKKYLGPYQAKMKISAYAPPKYQKPEMLIEWSRIRKITLGTWERFWARHWGILTSALAGEKMSKPEMAAQIVGIPVKRWKEYFLIIETKKSEFYAVEMNALMAYKTEQALKDLDRYNLLESKEYKI